MTDVGEESAFGGWVCFSTVTSLLDVKFLSNTGSSVLILDSNFWSDQPKTRGVCVCVCVWKLCVCACVFSSQGGLYLTFETGDS